MLIFFVTIFAKWNKPLELIQNLPIENLRATATTNAKQCECFAKCCSTKLTQPLRTSISEKFDGSTATIYGRKFDLPLSTDRIPTAAHATTSLLFLFTTSIFYQFIFILPPLLLRCSIIIILLIQMCSIDACVWFDQNHWIEYYFSIYRNPLLQHKSADHQLQQQQMQMLFR